jgi:hypothetical protein
MGDGATSRPWTRGARTRSKSCLYVGELAFCHDTSVSYLTELASSSCLGSPRLPKPKEAVGDWGEWSTRRLLGGEGMAGVVGRSHSPGFHLFLVSIDVSKRLVDKFTDHGVTSSGSNSSTGFGETPGVSWCHGERSGLNSFLLVWEWTGC